LTNLKASCIKDSTLKGGEMMRAEKITFSMQIEVLHMDCVPALLRELAHEVENDNTDGELCKTDGDYMKWGYSTKAVTF
jgi:hypothetical protein